MRETADGGPRCLGWQRCGGGPASDPLAPHPSELVPERAHQRRLDAAPRASRSPTTGGRRRRDSLDAPAVPHPPQGRGPGPAAARGIHRPAAAFSRSPNTRRRASVPHASGHSGGRSAASPAPHGNRHLGPVAGGGAPLRTSIPQPTPVSCVSACAAFSGDLARMPMTRPRSRGSGMCATRRAISSRRSRKARGIGAERRVRMST